MNAAERLLGAAALQRRGGQVALICGDEAVTYAELAGRMHAAAAALRSLGVRPGDRVVLLMRDTPECAAAWLGAVHAGAVPITVNSRLPEADCQHILRDSAARIAIVEQDLAQAHPSLVSDLARAGRLAFAGGEPGDVPVWRGRTRGAAPAAAVEVPADAAAFCLYSSGTTGKPKGIAYSHRAIEFAGQAFAKFGIGEGDRVFATSKLFFAYGLEHALLAPLAAGVTSIMCADWPEADSIVRVVAREKPTAMFSVPTVYRRLLGEAPEKLTAFRGIRRFVAAGERLSAQLFEHWRKATGGELLNLYGMSETFCACMVTPPGSSNGERTGLPLAFTEVRLRDEHGKEPAAGKPGVLWVRHPAMAAGYLNLPEQSRAQFRDGWFCSGDIFVRDEAGYFIHQGRADELLKVAGQWVRPAELEEVAARDPAIADAACVPVLDADGLPRLALFVIPRSAPTEAQQAAAAACERSLPPHKRPKWVRAVGELPRTASGKVQRFKLREILERELASKD